MFVMSTGEKLSNPEAMSYIAQLTTEGDDLSLLDPNHNLIRQDSRLLARVLEDRYQKVFIDDALETGHAFRDTSSGKILFRTYESAASFVGLVLEAYIVRCFNNSMRDVGRLALQWCSLRSNRPRDNFIDKFIAIGTGLKKTRNEFPLYYEPQSGVDVIFVCPVKKIVHPGVTHEPLNIMGTHVRAGIQVKAIQCNEMTEIIQPMLDNSYLNVLTLLKRPDGKHTADECMDIIEKLAKKNTITELQRRHLRYGICRPEEINLDQREIDNYYEYARACYEGRVQADEVVYGAIALEVKNWKYSDAGVLFPGTELFEP